MASCLLDITEEALREKLDPAIYVEPKDRGTASEDDRQIRLINRLKRDCPEIAFHAVPNGGRQSDWARTRGWRMGVIAGQPDLGFDWAGGSALIEMKDGRGNPSQDQVERLNRLHRMGKPVAICRNPDVALAWLRSIGAPVPIETAKPIGNLVERVMDDIGGRLK